MKYSDISTLRTLFSNCIENLYDIWDANTFEEPSNPMSEEELEDLLIENLSLIIKYMKSNMNEKALEEVTA